MATSNTLKKLLIAGAAPPERPTPLDRGEVETLVAELRADRIERRYHGEHTIEFKVPAAGIARRAADMIEHLAALALSRLPVEVSDYSSVVSSPSARTSCDEADGSRTCWHSTEERPQSCRRIVATYDDGSGANLFYVHDEGFIDADGDARDDINDSYDRWAYLPDGVRLWCEEREDDRFTFPLPPSKASQPASPSTGSARVAENATSPKADQDTPTTEGDHE